MLDVVSCYCFVFVVFGCGFCVGLAAATAQRRRQLAFCQNICSRENAFRAGEFDFSVVGFGLTSPNSYSCFFFWCSAWHHYQYTQMVVPASTSPLHSYITRQLHLCCAVPRSARSASASAPRSAPRFTRRLRFLVHSHHSVPLPQLAGYCDSKTRSPPMRGRRGTRALLLESAL